jgi:MFS family permease
MMALSGRIIRRVGVKPLLLAGLGAAMVRWCAYGLIHDYRIALAFSLLHGLSFAGFYVAGVTYIDRRVPAHLRSTGQAVFNGATFGLGSMAGSNLFGLLYDRLHAGGMYLVASAICAVAVIGITLLVPNQTVSAPEG